MKKNVDPNIRTSDTRLLTLMQWIFLALLVGAPLAFGAVTLGAAVLQQGLCFLALGLYGIDIMVNGRECYRIPGLLPLLLLLAYMLLQVVPLPAAAVKALSPQTYRLYQESIGLLEPTPWLPLSIRPGESLAEFFRYASHAAIYILGVQLLSHRAFLQRTVNTVAVFATLLAFGAILYHFTATGEVFWLRKSYNGTPFGPYVNRNHYAGLMGMLFPLLLALFLYNKPRVVYSSLRARVGDFFDHRMAGAYFLLSAGLVVVGVSIFLSLSRGGIISLCLAAMIFGLLLVVRGCERGKSLTIVVIFSLLLMVVGWYGWDPIFERFNQIRNTDDHQITVSRTTYWRASLEIWRDYPLTGSGFGTFADAYKGYQTPDIPGPLVHAHNDYIELLAEGGLIAAVLLVCFLGAIAATIRRYFKRRDTYAIYLYTGAVCSLLAIGFHSLVDFNLHIGANGLYFALICALCVAAAHTRVRSSGPTPSYLRVYGPRGWSMAKMATLPILMMVVVSVVYNGGRFVARLNFEGYLKAKQSEVSSVEAGARIEGFIERAIRFDPLNSLYHALRGNLRTSWGQSQQSAAQVAYETAVRRQPASGLYLQGLAELVSEMGDKETAEGLFQAALAREVSNPHRYAGYALYLMGNGRIQEGTRQMQTTIALAPQSTRRYLEMLTNKGLLPPQDLPRVLPARVAPHLYYAEYLAEQGQAAQANEAVNQALAYLDREPEVTEYFFKRIHHHYLEQNAYDAALTAIRMGIARLPQNAALRVLMADLYEKSGIKYRAIEEYQKALLLDAGNKTAQRRLAKLQPQ